MNCSESLADWKTRNRAFVSRMETATRDLDEAALNLQQNAKTWSPAQVVEHLVLTNRAYLPAMKAALERAGKCAGDPPIRYSFFGNFLMKAAGPNGNAPAPKALHPRTTPISRTILAEWQQQQAELQTLLDQSAGIDLSQIPIRNPLVSIIRMNLADCFAITTAHTERHIGQIEERVTPR